MLSTQSFMAALEQDHREEFLEAERQHLAEIFSGGIVNEQYVTSLTTATLP